MRVLEAISSFALLAAVVAGGSPPAAAGGELTISQETCQGLFLVPLSWTPDDGETQELLAVFDTGADGPTLIDPDAVERGSGRRVAEGTRVRMRGVAAGEARFTEFRPRVRELDHLSNALGRELDVLLPFRTFQDYLLTLDYPRGELRLSEQGLPAPDGVTIFSSRGPDRRPWLSVEIAGEVRRMLIDSGSTGPFSVRLQEGVDWQTLPRPVQLVQRLDETAVRRIGRLDEVVTLGPLTLIQPLVSLTLGTELIGAQVLEPLVISFDQKRRRVRLRTPSGVPVRMPSYRGTGALLAPADGALEFRGGVAGTPAAGVALEVGDRVVAIDGREVRSRGCRRPGLTQNEEERWTVRRGYRTLEIAVPVVDLVR